MAQLETQLESEKQQSQELAGQVAALTVDLTQAKQYGADADDYRSSLEKELAASRLSAQQLTDQVAELSRERAEFEVRLREERQSAARGMELLSLVQSTLSGAFHRPNEEKPQVDGLEQRELAAVAMPDAAAASPVEQRVEDEVVEPVEAPMAVGA